MAKKYIVELTDAEQEQLQQLLRKGKLSARKLKRAQILLAAHVGQPDEQIAKTVQVHVATIHRVRQRFVEGGMEYALTEKKRPGRKQKLDGKGEAVLVALACSDPPKGHTVWTMQMLADRLVELEIVDKFSGEAVRKRLKKTS